MYIVILALAAFVALQAYIRLAPSDPSVWNLPISATEPANLLNGAVRILPNDSALLTRVDDAMRTLPRTSVLAGSVDEGRITYVTRSRVMGFPDYTTVEADGETIKLFARLRFGSSDLGVNAARLDGLIAAVE